MTRSYAAWLWLLSGLPVGVAMIDREGLGTGAIEPREVGK